MGTRSLTVFREGKPGNSVRVATLYKQFDGHPDSWGLELSIFLRSKRLVNGLPYPTPKYAANGVGCLACQLIAKFKTEPGGLYLHHTTDADPVDMYGAEFQYTVFGDSIHPSGVTLMVLDVHMNETLFSGPPSEYGQWLKAYTG